MDNTITDKETIKSAMSFAAAILVFVSTISAIVNSRLQKAKNAAHRDKIISNTASFGCCFFSVLALIFLPLSIDLSFCFMLTAFAIFVVWFLWQKTPVNRLEIVILAFWFGGILFCVFLNILTQIVSLIREVAHRA